MAGEIESRIRDALLAAGERTLSTSELARVVYGGSGPITDGRINYLKRVAEQYARPVGMVRVKVRGRNVWSMAWKPRADLGAHPSA